MVREPGVNRYPGALQFGTIMMRKVRDYDAKSKAPGDKALKSRAVQQLGWLAVATGAGAADAETLAGILLSAFKTTDGSAREGRAGERRCRWRSQGRVAFPSPLRARRGQRRLISGAPIGRKDAIDRPPITDRHQLATVEANRMGLGRAPTPPTSPARRRRASVWRNSATRARLTTTPSARAAMMAELVAPGLEAPRACRRTILR